MLKIKQVRRDKYMNVLALEGRINLLAKHEQSIQRKDKFVKQRVQQIKEV